MNETRIKVTKATGARLSLLPEVALYDKQIGDYVTVCPDMVLELIGEKNGNIYFKVHYLFFENRFEAAHGSILYFTKNNYSKMAYKYV